MKKLKHSKYKNTALLFEMLVRQLTSDTLNNVPKSKAGSLIKKYFKKNTDLSKELQLYNSLKTEKFNDINKSNLLIEAVIKSRDNINFKALNRNKYNLVKELSESYDINDFFKSVVPDYPIIASIYKLFEYDSKDNPVDYTKNQIIISEYISTKVSKKEVKPAHLFEEQDKDVREIAYRLLVNKFNDKYTNLVPKQKLLIEKYITEVTNSTDLKKYIVSECNKLKKNLLKLNTKIDSEVVKIKISETVNILDGIKNNGKVAKDGEILTLLSYYELESELIKVL